MLQKKPIGTHFHLGVLLTRQGSAAPRLLISGTPSMSTSYCSVLRTGLLSKATQNVPSSMARNREIVIQYYGSVPSCQENVKGNAEIQKDANSSQLTLASSFKQAIGWWHKSSFLCFVTHRNRQFKWTLNVHSTKDFTIRSKLLILLLNPVK